MMIGQSPPAVQPAPVATDAGQLPADVRGILEFAIGEGDAATIERVFGYARRARPDAVAAIDALHATYQQQLDRKRREEATAAEVRLARWNPLVNWAGQLEFGASWTTGAASSLGLLGSVDVERKGVAWTHKLQVRGEMQETNGSRAVERVTASWQPRYSFGERGYTFGLTQYEHDPALGYDNRYSVGIGAGLRFGSPERLQLLVDGGPAVRRTDRLDESRTALAGRGSADLNWPLSSRLILKQKVAAFFEDGKTDGLSASSLDTQLSRNLKLRLSYEYRFENERPVANGGSTSRASFIFGL